MNWLLDTHLAVFCLTDPDELTRAEKAVIQTHPINRLGKAEEIAEAVLWLSTDASSFVSGVPMPIDGAYLAQ